MEIQDTEIKGRQYEPGELLEDGEWRVESDSLGLVKVPANSRLLVFWKELVND